MKKIINVKLVFDAIKIISEFNQLKLDECELINDDTNQVIPTTEECLKNFKFMGMNNVDYLKYEIWKIDCQL